MLFSSLTIAVPEKRSSSLASVIGWNSKDHCARAEFGRAICAFRIRPDGAFDD
jgi:hypothetical protein